MKKQQTSLAVLFLASGMALASGASQTAVNINKADTSALATVPGIGKHRAEAIIEYRQSHGLFKEVHDLIKVKGFSEKKLESILKHNPSQLSV
jgi:competence ComEA-like helix-hairpin-helix protein